MLPCSPSNDIRRKMKIKSIVSSIVLVVTSVLFISVVPAQAGNCSTEDPCQTYAMIDDAGVVTNIIVCQPSVCGSGTWAGQKVVPQVAADADGKNRGGFYNNPESGRQVTVQDNVFTIHETNPVVQKSTEIIEDVVTTITATTSNGASSSFTFNNTINAENLALVPSENQFNQNTSASVKVEQVTQSSETTTVGAEFQERTTLQAVEETLKAAAESQVQIDMVNRSIAKISSKLRKWLRLMEVM
jgi:hypothetical protein